MFELPLQCEPELLYIGRSEAAHLGLDLGTCHVMQEVVAAFQCDFCMGHLGR